MSIYYDFDYGPDHFDPSKAKQSILNTKAYKPILETSEENLALNIEALAVIVEHMKQCHGWRKKYQNAIDERRSKIIEKWNFVKITSLVWVVLTGAAYFIGGSIFWLCLPVTLLTALFPVLGLRALENSPEHDEKAHAQYMEIITNTEAAIARMLLMVEFSFERDEVMDLFAEEMDDVLSEPSFLN